VLAGAGELTLFNYYNFIEGHKGHHLLRMEFDKLADLAQVIRTHPVEGVSGYKPPNSDAGGDLYIMDFIGMIGIPLIPGSVYPSTAKVIFLPTQASADTALYGKVKKSLEKGSRIILTAGLLANVRNGKELAALAGIQWPVHAKPVRAGNLIVNNQSVKLESGLDLEAELIPTTSRIILEVLHDQKSYPFLLENRENNIYILNCHTFSQVDFDAAGEVLLCPRPLGLMEIPDSWANSIRNVFNQPLGINLEAPVRVTCQPFGEGDIMLQNYNPERSLIRLEMNENYGYYDRLNGFDLPIKDSFIEMEIPARSRVWITRKPT
jgi:hypothetical protein